MSIQIPDADGPREEIGLVVFVPEGGKAELEKLATEKGYRHGEKPSIGKLVSAILTQIIEDRQRQTLR